MKSNSPKNIESCKNIRLLFIGNSHTYFNDMPAMVAKLAEVENITCHVTMLAHSGWFLSQHVESPDVKFNITYGKYDYVILQEHSHPFGPIEQYEKAVRQLDDWIKAAGSRTVLFMPWAKREEPQCQAELTEVHTHMAEELGALLAPVGDKWWDYREAHPEIEMYYRDGAHASEDGSAFVAKVLWETMRQDIRKKA